MTAKSNGKFMILAGVGALIIMTRKSPRRRAGRVSGVISRDPANEAPSLNFDTVDAATGDPEDLDFDLGEGQFTPSQVDDPDAPFPESAQLTSAGDFFSAGSVLSRNTDAAGRAQLGMLYQVKVGDNPIEVCLEALFGSRSTPDDQGMLVAAQELLTRIHCGPWNQAFYAVSYTDAGRSAGASPVSKVVSFDPIYQDNASRILNGQRPTYAPGSSYALIWIPMINLDKFDYDMSVTTEGANHPDTARGIGGSMIDPPEDILDLDFDEVSSEEVGCLLPEGDFRRVISQR